jgi:hypothetical protein
MITATPLQNLPTTSPAPPDSRGQAGSRAEDVPQFDFSRLNLKRSGRWVILETIPVGVSSRKEPGGFGRFGLWKSAGGCGQELLVFEIPAPAIQRHREEEPSGGPVEPLPGAFAEWAAASLRDEIPSGWTPPDRELVESWLPAGALTVQLGPFPRQAELVLGPRRWSMRISILPRLPAALPRERARQLAALAADASQHWRMVRVGLPSGEEGIQLAAEVDLTGAPHSEPLFLACLDSLRHVAVWLAEPADLLSDATVALHCLEAGRVKTRKTERKQA